MRTIGIYHDDEVGTLAHIVDTLEQASKWLGVSRRALYYSLKINGVMRAKGFTVELIPEEIQEETNEEITGLK